MKRLWVSFFAAIRHPIGAGFATLVIAYNGFMSRVGPTRCEDGWASPSIGTQGACSWHGGVDNSPAVNAFMATVACTMAVVAWRWIVLVRREAAEAPQKWADYEAQRKAQLKERGLDCPLCGDMMQRRTAQRGPNRGGYFMSCSRYPKCVSTRPLNERERAMWGDGPPSGKGRAAKRPL